MVDPPLHLDALGGAGLVDRHQAGVVDQQVQPVTGQGVGARGHGVEVGEVERAHLQPRRGVLGPDARPGRLRPGGVAAGQDDLGAAAGERA